MLQLLVWEKHVGSLPGGETWLVVLLVLVATAEVVGLGADVSCGWLQGGLFENESPRGELGCVLQPVGGGSHH